MKLNVIVIGCGNRGMAYTDIMATLPEKFKVIAAAEPIESRRNYIKEKHDIAEDMCFTDWKPLLEKGKIADIALIATMDRDHFAPAMAAIEAGYNLILEKPISSEPAECKKIMEAAEKKGVKVIICTVLRYTNIFKALKNVIASGKIGKVMSINHEECVGNVHQSHSFVRGNWGNEEKSSSMLLQKSCHDMDILQWLIDKKCKKVQSFGTLSYFRRDAAPEGSPEYCIEGCPAGDKCPYNAVKLYLEDKDNIWFRSTCTRNVNPTDEMVEKSLAETQYGKCVYKCDNTVVDHQTVNLLFEDDITITFTMSAFTKGGRFIHIMGTEGEIHAAISENAPIEIYDFETGEKSEISSSGINTIDGGHAGGDDGIINDIYEYFNGTYKGNNVPDIKTSYENHVIVFAAEKSRRENVVVDFDEYIKNI